MAARVNESMRDRLRAAESFDALESLRKEWRKYNNAKPNTRGKWRKAYNERWSQLEAAQPETVGVCYVLLRRAAS